MDDPAAAGSFPLGQGASLSASRSRPVLGVEFNEATGWLDIREFLTAPQSPWQNPYVEHLIGTIRRECPDHVIVLNETGLRRVRLPFWQNKTVLVRVVNPST
jgi:hypothetical protein